MSSSADKRLDGLDAVGRCERFTAAPPQLVAFVASDPANADMHFGDGDQLLLAFDVYTDQSGQLATREAECIELTYLSNRQRPQARPTCLQCLAHKVEAPWRTPSASVVESRKCSIE